MSNDFFGNAMKALGEGFRAGLEKKRIIAQRKAEYKKTRASNELLRTRILSVLPFGKGKQGMKCGEITDKINSLFFDYRILLKKELSKKISQNLQVLKHKKPPQVEEKLYYWKRVIPKSKPIA